MRSSGTVTDVGIDLGGVILPDTGETLMDWIARLSGVPRADLEAWRKRHWDEDAHRPAPPGQEAALWADLRSSCPSAAIPDVPAILAMTAAVIQPFPGVVGLLDRVAARARLSIVSNQTEYWARRIVDGLGLARLVPPERRIWSYAVGRSKSSPGLEMFRAWHAAVPDAAPERMLFLDDRAHNVTRALEFGCQAIQVPACGESSTTAPFLEDVFRDHGLL